MGKRGPKPQGEAALTPAERQARYRVARQAGTPAVRYRKGMTQHRCCEPQSSGISLR